MVPATRETLTVELRAACDRAGVRILTLGDPGSRAVARLGLAPPLRTDAAGWEIAAALSADALDAPRLPVSPSRITTVWGPHGAPGRSTVAIQLAVELARRGRRTALADADTVAPSLALLLGMDDDAPGLAGACRRAGTGALDPAELSRLSVRLLAGGTEVDVLAGLNRPSRGPAAGDPRGLPHLAGRDDRRRLRGDRRRRRSHPRRRRPPSARRDHRGPGRSRPGRGGGSRRPGGDQSFPPRPRRGPPPRGADADDGGRQSGATGTPRPRRPESDPSHAGEVRRPHRHRLPALRPSCRRCGAAPRPADLRRRPALDDGRRRAPAGGRPRCIRPRGGYCR